MKRPFAVLGIYVLLTLALTYPLIFQLATALPSDNGDPVLNTWILWWNAHALPYTAAWWNAPAFYPSSGALAFSENLLGLSVIASPIQWLGGGPQLAYNIVLLLTFPLSAIGAYLLTFELTGRRDAAFIGGLLFGFAPYRIAHLPQIQCLAAFPMPFALLGLHRYLRDPRQKWLWLFGIGWFLQAICNGYYMLFFAVVVGLWIVWFGTRAPLSRLVPIVMAWVIASLPMAPLLWQYREIHEGFGFTREFGTIRDFGADVAAFFNAAGRLEFWGWLKVYRRAEGELFPGLTIALLVMAGLVAGEGPTAVEAGSRPKSVTWLNALRTALIVVAVATTAIAMSVTIRGPWRLRVGGVLLFSVSNSVKPLTYALALSIALVLTSSGLRRAFAARSVLGFYALAAFVTWLFSLGPAPSLMGKPFMYRGPYALLMFLPGFNALRVPARFWMMTILCLSVIGAVIFDRLAGRQSRKRLVACVVVSIGVLADGWVSGFPLVKAPAPWAMEACADPGDGALMELPIGDPIQDVAAMYRGMSHGHPLVNGYSGFFPPHYAALRFGMSMRDDDMLTQLASLGVSRIAVSARQDGDGRWRRYVEAHAGARLVCADESGSLYHLSKGERDTAAAPTGAVLPIAVVRANVNDVEVKLLTDGDRTTRWQSGPQRDRTTLDIDLGTERRVNGVQLLLGPFVGDFPRDFAIEMLGGGAVWKQIYRGGTAGRVFAGALQSPQDVPLNFTFAPETLRYLRLRTLSNEEQYYWSVAELKVFGP